MATIEKKCLEKKSVLKANKKEANFLWECFQRENDKKENQEKGIIFKRKEISDYNGIPLKEGSFEILFTMMVEDKRKGKVIFRFLDKDIQPGAKAYEIQWVPRFVTIPD